VFGGKETRQTQSLLLDLGASKPAFLEIRVESQRQRGRDREEHEEHEPRLETGE
jgi:hypothetical protein